jgi:spore germination cell wall hydrolase CwlJ-like protein
MINVLLILMKYGIKKMFSCYLGGQRKQKNQTEPEVSNISHQEEKRNSDPLPSTAVTPGSSISQILSTLPKYPSKFNTSEGNGVHHGTQLTD